MREREKGKDDLRWGDNSCCARMKNEPLISSSTHVSFPRSTVRCGQRILFIWKYHRKNMPRRDWYNIDCWMCLGKRIAMIDVRPRESRLDRRKVLLTRSCGRTDARLFLTVCMCVCYLLAYGSDERVDRCFGSSGSVWYEWVALARTNRVKSWKRIDGMSSW